MEDTSPLSLQSIKRVIAQRWGLVLFASVVSFGALSAYILSLKPAYTAQAVVLLAPMADELGEAQNNPRNATTTDPFFIRSEAAIISSDELSRNVIVKLDLTKSAEFAPQPGLKERLGLASSKAAVSAHPYLSNDEVALDEVMRAYQERLGVFNDGRSKTVQITFTAGNPRLAAQIANAHAEAYLQEQSTRREKPQAKSVDWLKQEVDARAKETRDADALVQQYQLQHGIVTTQNATMVEQRLSQLSTQLTDARRQLSTQAATLAEIRDLRAGGDPSNAANLLANEPLTDLLRSRVQAEADLSSMETRLVSTHPSLVKARQTLASINEVLEKQLLRAENEAQAGLNSSQRQVNELSRAVGAETSNKEGQDKASAALPALMAEAQVKRTVFETVLNRYQTQLAEQGFTEPTAAIVSRAAPPAQASFPRTSLFLVAAAMASVLIGFGAAFLVHMMRPAPVTLNGLADAIGIRALVAIPRFRNESRESGEVKIRDPRLYIESIRSLRHAIFEQHSTRETRVCLFTSVVPSQGKTLVAMSVARSLARSGTRTLFLEMDLRCPAASRLAHLPEISRGVASVLEMRTPVNDVLQRDESTGLDMLLAEKNASVSLDRLTVAAFAALLGKLRSRYDAIIVDSPPVGVISDSLTLASASDQTVVVARDGETSTEQIAYAVRLLKERGATISGLVLTDVDPKQLEFADRTISRYVMGMPARLALVKSS